MQWLTTWNKKWVGGVGLLILVAIIGFFWMKGSQHAAPDYVTGRVERGTIHSVINATGTINPVHYVDVATNVAGELEHVYVKANQHVNEGDIIATIDGRQLEAIAANAKATYDNAQAEYNRMATLVNEGVVSEQAFDNAKAALARARADYDRAAANVADTIIRAPMSGTIVGTPLQPGQTISTGISTQMIICTIADLSDLEIYVNVDETDIGSVKKGSKVEFTVDAHPGKVYTGQVSDIVLGNKGTLGTVSSNVVYYSVRVSVDPKDVGDFLPSMTARTTIFGKEATDSLVVPLAAVRTDKVGEYVYVLQDGKPKRVSVVTGITGDTNIQILQGLHEGDTIVVSGDVEKGDAKSNGPRHPGA